jgi:hypothetical protein
VVRHASQRAARSEGSRLVGYETEENSKQQLRGHGIHGWDFYTLCEHGGDGIFQERFLICGVMIRKFTVEDTRSSYRASHFFHPFAVLRIWDCANCINKIRHFFHNFDLTVIWKTTVGSSIQCEK